MVENYPVITLCGSTRFKEAFMRAQKELTLNGNIVISVGLFGHSGDNEVWTEGTKTMLDDMHKRKIDMADEIFVINVGGYIGSSTRSEIDYAAAHGKRIRYLEGQTVFFWHEYEENGCFSNWYDSPFELGGEKFRHAEQFIMARKAKLFGDEVHYRKIMAAEKPDECKHLGRQVSGYDDNIWKTHREEILKAALRAKFTQNEALSEKLLSTGGAQMAEASPGDQIFGIGLTAEKAVYVRPEQWPGQNLLGKALMELRTELSQARIPREP